MERVRRHEVDDVDVRVVGHGQAIAAAQAGKHVFCERPMAVSVERWRGMIEACEAADCKLAVGYRCQYDPHHLEMIRLAQEQKFGAVRVIESSFGFTVGDPNQWRLNKALHPRRPRE